MTDNKKTLKDFYTREKSNDGARLPLVLPDGTLSSEWVEVYGVDSDVFRENEARARREGARIALIKDPVAKDRALAELSRSMRAALIKAWSFDVELTPEAALEFIREAPQVGDAIESITTERTLFFALASTSSSPTPDSSSSSTPSQKAPSKVGAQASNKSRKQEPGRKS